MNSAEMWAMFTENDPVNKEYEEWEFGESPDALAELVVQGIKTATSSAYDLYEAEGEPLPRVGDYSVILDSQGNAKCIIRNVRVYIAPFGGISEEHAFKEGEGDCSPEYWREVHARFFGESLKAAGIAFSEETRVVCEEFEVVFRESDAEDREQK